MTKQDNLSDNLKKLNEIADWFDKQPQVDVEEGLKKVKEAAVLIKESKARLKAIENEFTEIQAEINDEATTQPITYETETIVVTEKEPADTLKEDDIPF